MKFKVLTESVVSTDDIKPEVVTQQEPDYEAIRKKKRADAYRKAVGMGSDEPLNMDTLEEWAVNKVAMENAVDVDDLLEDLKDSAPLTEGTTLGDAIDDAKDVVGEDALIAKGSIETALDRALKENIYQNKRGTKNFINILLVGESGMGKTARVNQWAKANSINLLYKSLASTDEADIGGAVVPSKDFDRVLRLSTSEFDQLDEPRSVLFLDEFNRGSDMVRGSVLTLINDHYIPGGGKGGRREFPNFLFTVAAVNPFTPEGTYNVRDMDVAEDSRFRTQFVHPENKVYLSHITQELQSDLKFSEQEQDEERVQKCKGQLGIIKALVGSKEFEFDSTEDVAKSREGNGNRKVLNYRTLTNLLAQCDGTKDDFLALWSDFTNSLKKPMAERILRNYKDVTDKANSVFNTKTDDSSDTEDIFGGDSPLAKINAKLRSATITN